MVCETYWTPVRNFPISSYQCKKPILKIIFRTLNQSTIISSFWYNSIYTGH